MKVENNQQNMIWNKINSILKKLDSYYVMMILLVIIGYVFIHDLIGETLLDHNAWDSYTLQAMRWLEGKVGLGQNYEHLELAIYKGDWFVSFPPFPSVLMLPWVLIFGSETPNNIIMILYILIALTLCYKIARKFKVRESFSVFWSVVVVLGCNMLWMSTMGGVWFQAQLVNMMLLLAAIYSMLYNKRTISYICVACAVGCRPFSIVYFLVLLVYYYCIDLKEENTRLITEKEDSVSTTNKIDDNTNIDSNKDKINNKEETRNNKENCILRFIRLVFTKQYIGLVCAAIIGLLYMMYNEIRFDNPLEFGHNYLPEFLNSPKGQFNISYIKHNLYRVFIRGISFNKKLGLDFTIFDGFWMYVANPIFIILFICIIRSLLNKTRFEPVKTTIICALAINVICLCMHKTLGGWQFGNRYFVDLIPFAFLYILYTKNQMKTINKLSKWEMFIGIVALMFNAYGVAYMYVEPLLR